MAGPNYSHPPFYQSFGQGGPSYSYPTGPAPGHGAPPQFPQPSGTFPPWGHDSRPPPLQPGYAPPEPRGYAWQQYPPTVPSYPQYPSPPFTPSQGHPTYPSYAQATLSSPQPLPYSAESKPRADAFPSPQFPPASFFPPQPHSSGFRDIESLFPTMSNSNNSDAFGSTDSDSSDPTQMPDINLSLNFGGDNSSGAGGGGDGSSGNDLSLPFGSDPWGNSNLGWSNDFGFGGQPQMGVGGFQGSPFAF